MKDAFGINPIVFRLCTFDPEALDYVEKKYKVPRQVVIAFIVSLANLGTEIVDVLLEKDMYRTAYLEIEKNNRNRKEMKRRDEERRIREEAKAAKKKARELRKQKKEQKRLERQQKRLAKQKKREEARQKKQKIKEEKLDRKAFQTVTVAIAKQIQQREKKEKKEAKAKEREARLAKKREEALKIRQELAQKRKEAIQAAKQKVGQVGKKVGKVEKKLAKKVGGVGKKLGITAGGLAKKTGGIAGGIGGGIAGGEDEEETKEEEGGNGEQEKVEEEEEDNFNLDDIQLSEDEEEPDDDQDGDLIGGLLKDAGDTVENELESLEDEESILGDVQNYAGDLEEDLDDVYGDLDEELDEYEEDEEDYDYSEDYDDSEDYDQDEDDYSDQEDEDQDYDEYYDSEGEYQDNEDESQPARAKEEAHEGEEEEEEAQFDPLNTRYDSINFENSNYEAWYRQIIKSVGLQGEEKIDEEDEDKEEEEKGAEGKYYPHDDEAQFDPEGEVIECVIFNTPDFMCYDYDKIMGPGKAKRNFKLEKPEIQRIIGKKNDWNRALSSTFFKKPEDPDLWEVDSQDDVSELDVFEEAPPEKKEPEKNFLGFERFNWIRKNDRKHVKNIWTIMKKLLRDMSKDLKVTNGATHDYDRIELTQFFFAISILDVRKTLDSDSYTGKVEDFTKVVCSFEQMFSWIERNAIIPARLNYQFHPNRMLKVLGMALNMKISNYFDYFENWRPQLFNGDLFQDFSKKSFKSEQDLSDTNESYLKYLHKMKDDGKIYGMLLYEVDEFLVAPERSDQNKELFQNTYIEDQRTARDRWPSHMPRFDYTPTKWKKEIATTVDNELAQLLMVVPKEIHDLYQQEKEEQTKNVKDQVKIADQRSQMPIQKVYKFFEELERFLIAQPEPMQLIIGIANNDESVWNIYKEELKRASIIQKDSALQVYKSVQKLINLKRSIKEYKYQKTKSNDRMSIEPPDIKPVLNSLTTGLSLDPIMVEDLIMLAQGNMDQSHFVNLTNRFNLPPNLLRTFFLSALIHFLQRPKQLQDFMKPMIRLLGIDSRILTAIVNIVNYTKIGWEILGINLTKPTITVDQVDSQSNRVTQVQLDAFDLIVKMLSTIDWVKLRSQYAHKTMSSEQLKLTKGDYVTRMLEIADKLDGQRAYRYVHNQKVRLLLELMHEALVNDFSKSMDLIKKLGPELKFDLESETLKQFTSISLLTGKFDLSHKVMDSLVKEAKKTLQKWLSLQMVYAKNPEQVTSYLQQGREKAKGLVELLFGYKYNFDNYLDKAAEVLGGRFEKIYWVLRTIDNVKYYKKLELTKILRNERAGEYLRKSFFLIAKLVDDSIRGKWQSEDQKEEEESKNPKSQGNETRYKSAPLQSKICLSWEDMEEDEEEFEEKYQKYTLKTCIPESERRVRGWLRRKNRSPGELGELEKEDVYLTLMTSLMGGDVHLFLTIMADYVVNQDNMADFDNQIVRTASLARSTFKMMNLSRGKFISQIKKLFKEDLNLQKEDSKLNEGAHEEEHREMPKDQGQDETRDEAKPELKGGKKSEAKKDAAQFEIMEFAQQLSALNVLHFQNKIDRLNKTAPDYQTQRKKYEFAIEIFNKPDLLRYAFTTLLAIKFGVLGRQVVTSLIVKFAENILAQSKIDPVVKESFTLLVEVFSGRQMNEIQTMSQQGSSFTFVDKVEKLIAIVTNLFLPDLKSAQGLFRKLVNIVTSLLNVKSLSEFGEILAQIAPDVGEIFNADPVIVTGLVGILKGDYEALAQMAAPIAKIDPETIRSTVNFLEDIKNAMLDFDGQKGETSDDKQFKGDRWKEVMANIAAGKASYRELFEMLDAEGDGSGGISKDEFSMLLRRLQMKFSSHRIDEIFTSVQKKVSGAADDNPNELNELEFQEAMKYVESKQASSTLKLLGISTGQLVFLFLVLTFILLLLFVFIFLGVSALSVAGSGAFGAIINSVLPMASGAAVMQKKETDQETQQKNADQAVEESDKILQAEE